MSLFKGYCSEKAIIRRRRVKVQKTTLLFGMSRNDGLINAEFCFGAVDENVFCGYLIRTLNKFTKALEGERGVVVMDNSSIHRTENVRKILSRFNYIVMDTARYSCELMPTEYAFGNWKSEIQIHSKAVKKGKIVGYLNAALNKITKRQVLFFFLCAYFFLNKLSATVTMVETQVMPMAMEGMDLDLKDLYGRYYRNAGGLCWLVFV
jgi:transposase